MARQWTRFPPVQPQVTAACSTGRTRANSSITAASPSMDRATCTWPTAVTTAWNDASWLKSPIRQPRVPPTAAVSRVVPIGRAAAALALLLVVGVQPVAAQAIDPDGCATMKEQIRYLTNE